MNQPCLVIMAAGMGSRFGGPKQTTPVDEYGHFLLHYSLFDAYRAGFRKVVFVVKEDTAEEFRESVGPAVAAAFDVRYAYQKLDTLPAGYAVPAGRTKPWGTAHAVLCAAPEIDGPFAVINSDDYYGIEAYRLLYDFLAVPHPERSYAMVGFRLRNTVTANGSVSRGVCTERNGMLESITERTHIEQRGADAAYTEDGEHFIDLPGDTTVSMNFWGFSPLYLRELARRFPAFLDENLPRNPLKCEYFVINSDDYYGIEAYRLLYDFLAVPHPERSYAMVGFRLRNTVTANGSVSRGVCTERNGMLESITERTHIEQRGADAAYTEDGEHFIDLPGDTTVSMNFWGFSPLYLRELARRFPAFLDENLPRNPLKCEYFVPSIVDAQLRAGTADVTMLHTDDAWHGVTYHDDLPDVVAALRALRDAGKYPDNIW